MVADLVLFIPSRPYARVRCARIGHMPGADGRVGLGGPQMTTAATALRDVVSQIDTDAVGEPAFRLVVTGTGSVLTLDDGTVTCPRTCCARRSEAGD